MARNAPEPHTAAIDDDLSLAAVAAEGKWRAELAGVPMTEMLCEIAQLIAKRSHLRVLHRRTVSEPDKITAALTAAERACIQLGEVLTAADDFAGLMDMDDSALVTAVLEAPKLSRDHRVAGVKLLLEVRRQSKHLAEIVAVAAQLENLIADYRREALPVAPDKRADILRQEFIAQAVDAWTFLTGKKPSRSKGGPFVRFATALWLAAEMPELGETPEFTLGTYIDRILKLQQV